MTIQIPVKQTLPKPELLVLDMINQRAIDLLAEVKEPDQLIALAQAIVALKRVCLSEVHLRRELARECGTLSFNLSNVPR